jgi:hypothetical protein
MARQKREQGQNQDQPKDAQKSRPASRRRKSPALLTESSSAEAERIAQQELSAMVEQALSATTAEVHTHQYPIFHLTPHKPTDSRITYTETVKQGGETLTRQWAVSVQPYYGWPGQHEAEVWRAIEHIIHIRRLAGTLKNPLLTSFSEIREHMSGKGKGGTNVARIKHSLGCLGSTKIESDLFYNSDTRIRAGVAFSLLASVLYYYKDLPGGRRLIDKLSIRLPEELFINIQNRHIRPLDKGFRDGLDRWIAKRLYELLGIKFFALRKKFEPYRTRYSRLCSLVGITRQMHLSWARRVLGRAHEELAREGFLSKVEWFAVTGEERDWVLSYWPGERARAEWRQGYWVKHEPPALLLVDKLPPTELEPAWVDELSANETGVSAQLESDEPPLLHQPMIPLEVEAPEELDPAPDSRPRSSRDAPRGSSRARQPTPVPQGHPGPSTGVSAYAQAAIEAFERATGKHRRLARLTEAERAALAKWETLGVSVQDIEQGTRQVLSEFKRRSAQEGTSRDVVSLAYASGAVLDAAAKRQELEWMRQETIRKVRAAQSTEAQEAESTLKSHLRARSRPEFYAALFGDLLVAEKAPDCFIVLVPSDDLHPVYNSRADEFEKVLGLPPVFGDLFDWAKGL